MASARRGGGSRPPSHVPSEAHRHIAGRAVEEPVVVTNSVVHAGMPPDRGAHQSELVHVQPYQKKYLQGVPGSSPVIRAVDDLNFQQKYGKGPLMERVERLKRLQELKDNMNQRANERGESDDGAIRMIKDTRMKRIGVEDASRRAPSSQDIIHKHKEADVQILYTDDRDSNLPSIHGS